MVYEILVKLYLLDNISSKDVLEQLSSFIDSCFGKSEKWTNFHKEKAYKLYTFNQPWPLEKDKIYKEGSLYTFNIRTVNKELADYLLTNLRIHETKKIKGIVTEIKIVPKKILQKIFTITPLIIKTEKGYWKDNMSLEDFERRIFDNLVKKYNDYKGEKIEENFDLYTCIKFLNSKPIATSYKNITLLGDNIELELADNEMAQELGYFALGVGSGEANSRGFGYVNYRYL